MDGAGVVIGGDIKEEEEEEKEEEEEEETDLMDTAELTDLKVRIKNNSSLHRLPNNNTKLCCFTFFK